MFRSNGAMSERSRSLLKGKDVKTLRSRVITAFPSASEDEIDLLMGGKTGIVAVRLMDRTFVYEAGDGRGPLFFDPQGRGAELFPTVQALALVPNLMGKRTLLVPPAVSRFVLSGADLMAPGIYPICFPAIQEALTEHSSSKKASGAEAMPICIRAVGNPVPFAVGRMVGSMEHLLQRQGRVVEVLHCYTDPLAPPRVGGNLLAPGFTSTEIKAVEEENCGMESSDDEEEEEQQQEGEENGECATASEVVADGEAEADDDDNEEQDQGEKKEEEVNAQIEEALALTLRYLVKDQTLPMLASAFWVIVKQCADVLYEGQNLDIRHSRFRRVGALLEFYRRDGLLTTEENNGNLSVVSISRDHPLLRKYTSKDAQALRTAVTGGSVDPEGSKITAGGKIRMETLYKMPATFVRILHPPQGKYGIYYRMDEVRDFLVKYLKTDTELHNDSDPSLVLIPPSHGLHPLLRPYAARLRMSSAQPVKVGAVEVPKVQEEDEYEEDIQAEDDEYAMDDDDEYNEDAVNSSSSSFKASSNLGLDAWDASSALPTMKVSNQLIDVEKAALPTAAERAAASAKKEKKAPVVVRLSDMLATEAARKAESQARAEEQRQAEIARLTAEGNTAALKKMLPKNHHKKALAAALTPDEPFTLSKADFFKGITAQFVKYYATINAYGDMSVKSQPAAVVVSVSKRSGRNMVTNVTGLETMQISAGDLAGLSKLLRTKLAVSVAVKEPGSLVIQGSVAPQVCSFFIDQVGLPRACLTMK